MAGVTGSMAMTKLVPAAAAAAFQVAAPSVLLKMPWPFVPA